MRFAICAVLAAALAAPVVALPATLTREEGGSDYMFYSLDGCQRSGWVTPAYLSHRALIDGQLAAMYRSGQRRLRISLQLAPGSTEGMLPDTPIGAAYEQDVSAFLEQIKRTGFSEILVSIGGGQPPPFSWKTWDEDAYRFRWQRLVTLRELLVRSNLKYYLDLLGEGIPAQNQPMLLKYSHRLWTDYVQKFGTSDTVGFSLITSQQQDRFAQLREVYGDTPPPVFDLHIYEDSGATFLNAHKRLAEMGFGNIPWIIGESFYNDPEEASELADAIRQTGQPVLFLLEWPLTSAKQCKDVDVAFPEAFDVYLKAGF